MLPGPAVMCPPGPGGAGRAAAGQRKGPAPPMGRRPLQGGLEEESGAGMDPRSWREDGERALGAGEMFTNERSQRVIGFGQIKRGTLC